MNLALYLTVMTTLFSFLPASPLQESRQLIAVTSTDWSAPKGTLQRYEKRDGVWVKRGQSIKVNLGRNGLGWGKGVSKLPKNPNDPVKKEGDGRAPAGIFTLGDAFGYGTEPINPGYPYLAVTAHRLCIDDSSSEAYNTIVYSEEKSRFNSFEVMRRDDHQYRLGVVINHNAKNEKGAGSCIFFHIQKQADSPTAGCTAMSGEAIETLIRWLDKTKNPLLIQLPKERFDAVFQDRF